MGKIFYILIFSFFLFISCVGKEEQIIRNAVSQYIEIYGKEFSKTNLFIEVDEIFGKWNDLKIFTIQTQLFNGEDTPDSFKQTGIPFQYSTHFKLQNIDIFLRKQDVPLKKIEEDLFYELYVEGVWVIDPFITILVLNPDNRKYILVEDNQRYLSIDSLLQESVARIRSIRN